MEWKESSMNMDERVRELNIAKDKTLDALCEDGFLTEEEAHAMKFHYHVSLVKPSYLSSLYKRFFKEDGENSRYFVISKLVGSKQLADVPDFPTRKKGELKVLTPNIEEDEEDYEGED